MSEEQQSANATPDDGKALSADMGMPDTANAPAKRPSIFPLQQTILFLIVIAGLILNQLFVKDNNTRTYIFIALVAVWFLPRIFNSNFLRKR